MAHSAPAAAERRRSPSRVPLRQTAHGVTREKSPFPTLPATHGVRWFARYHSAVRPFSPRSYPMFWMRLRAGKSSRRVRQVDLKTIDFANLKQPTRLPLDKEKKQDIEDVTLQK